MVSLWYKYKELSPKKKQTLYSVFAGFICFVLLYVLTLFVGGSLCPIKRFFGISCPGCGLTRGFISILKHDFVSATKYNIMSIPLFMFVLVYCFFVIYDFIFSKNVIETIEKQLTKKYMYPMYFIVLVVSYIVNYKI